MDQIWSNDIPGYTQSKSILKIPFVWVNLLLFELLSIISCIAPTSNKKRKGMPLYVGERMLKE